MSSFSPNVGDIVLIKDEIARGLWKLGKLIELIPSGDKKLRSAKVEMSSGRVIKRPLNLLFPIESRRKCENVLEEKSTLLQDVHKNKDDPLENLQK